MGGSGYRPSRNTVAGLRRLRPRPCGDVDDCHTGRYEVPLSFGTVWHRTGRISLPYCNGKSSVSNVEHIPKNDPGAMLRLRPETA